MDVKIVNPFLAATINVLETMANITPIAGKPFLKDDQAAMGDVSAIIGITGAAQGSMALSFTESCLLEVVSGLYRETVTELSDDVKDAVGELTNIICGDARRRLSEEGITLQAGIPTVVSGRSHTIRHVCAGPRLAVPFSTPCGTFVVEVAFSA